MPYHSVPTIYRRKLSADILCYAMVWLWKFASTPPLLKKRTSKNSKRSYRVIFIAPQKANSWQKCLLFYSKLKMRAIDVGLSPRPTASSIYLYVVMILTGSGSTTSIQHQVLPLVSSLQKGSFEHMYQVSSEHYYYFFILFPSTSRVPLLSSINNNNILYLLNSNCKRNVSLLRWTRKDCQGSRTLERPSLGVVRMGLMSCGYKILQVR